MNSLQYKKNEFKKFCVAIGAKPVDVTFLCNKMEDYYSEWVEKKIDKKTGLPKKYLDGTEKQRVIRPPRETLKQLQRKINSELLAKINLPFNVHGGVKKRSNISNAKAHQGNTYIFTTDLQEFYPSITNKMVYQALRNLKFSTHLSHWITLLTTWKYEVPQGAPTSTQIANIVFLETDIKLIALCDKNGIVYTRYVDDLTFSSNRDFKHLVPSILDIIKGSFKVSYRKTFYKRNQTITGIDVYLNKIDAPIKIIEKAKQEVNTKAARTPYKGYVKRIRTAKKIKSS